MTETERIWTNRRLVRWHMTEWCNYNCSYCPQDHGRRTGRLGHWTDNKPVEDWLAALKFHFNQYKLSLLISGGEPMIDYKNLHVLVSSLLEEDYVDAIKIDTNLSVVRPMPVDERLVFMASYHPEHTGVVQFLLKLDKAEDMGWNFLVINIVAKPGDFENIRRVKRTIELNGFHVSILPKDGCLNEYSAEEIADLRSWIPPADWHIRTGGSPMGMTCLHPAVAYKMYGDGSIEVGCHSRREGNLFGTLPVLFEHAIPCPRGQCFCTEKYTFTMDVNHGPMPLKQFTERLALI